MLQQFPTMLQEMDHHDITRECWMCLHRTAHNSVTDKCTSHEMKESIERFVGVTFNEAFILPINQETDASSCTEFILRNDETTHEALMELIEEKAEQYRAHADHYAHLRREYA